MKIMLQRIKQSHLENSIFPIEFHLRKQNQRIVMMKRQKNTIKPFFFN